MEAAGNISDGVCYIFQPHGFAPTRMMKDEYVQAFTENLRGSDHLVLLPIFYAGGTAARDISSHVLLEGIRAGGKSAEVLAGREEILGRLDNWQCYVIMGARDETLSGFARDIADALASIS
jgi:UDP-N-acetylmuramate--alanine ligase